MLSRSQWTHVFLSYWTGALHYIEFTTHRNLSLLHARPATDGLIHHSDRGVQYLSIRYTERLAEAGIEPSVGSVGDSIEGAERAAMEKLSGEALLAVKRIDNHNPAKNAHKEYWQRRVQRPPYSRLKEEVESLGYRAVGRKYGVSDNSIRKWLRFYESGQQTVA